LCSQVLGGALDIVGGSKGRALYKTNENSEP
jgi:hypothetical protein